MMNPDTTLQAPLNPQSLSTRHYLELTTAEIQSCVSKGLSIALLSDQEARALLDLGIQLARKRPSAAFLFAASSLMLELRKQQLKDERSSYATNSPSSQAQPNE